MPCYFALFQKHTSKNNIVDHVIGPKESLLKISEWGAEFAKCQADSRLYCSPRLRWLYD